MLTGEERTALLPEIRVTGNRFIVREKTPNTSETQAVSVSDQVQVSRTEEPVEKTGIIPKHVWG